MLNSLLLWLQDTLAPISHQSLWVQIPEIVGIPLLALGIIVLLREMSSTKQYGPEDAAEMGMELSILAAGACGAIFANDTLYAKWGVALIIYGIVVSLGCILCATILARTRRWNLGKTVSIGKGIAHLIFGAVPLGAVTALLILGYTFSPGR
jgi:hypothetical protein